jgi:hypothetical protein
MAARIPPSAIASLKKMGKDTKDLEAHAKVQGIEKANYYWPIYSQGIIPPDYHWRENLRLVQAELRGFLKEWTETESAGLFLKPYGKAKIYFGRDEGKFKLIYDPDEPSFTGTTDPSKLAEKARLSLIFALDGIPDEGAIKTCRECRKYFLHLSKKPKFFCDYKCTVKFTSRRRREKDPEGYRASQREIMRKQYRKEQAKKRGVPVGKVKIQKRRKKDGR